jgi:hypothetical protein
VHLKLFHVASLGVLLCLAWNFGWPQFTPRNSGASATRTLYVSPKGSPTGDGARDKPLDLARALSDKSPAAPGDTILLLGGVYEGEMAGTSRVPFKLGVSGTAASPVRIMPAPGQSAHLNGTVYVTSSYAHYLNLEIGDLDWEPSQKKHKTEPALDVRSGSGTKFINCNFFGGAMGTAGWTPAIDLEIYGSLIHDFGSVEETGRGHGHAWYSQNKEGTKVFQSNIAYRGYGWNVHIYTQEGDIQGFDIIDNICYIAGALKPEQTVDNYLISGYRPADRIRMIGNVGYQPSNIDKWRPNARLSSYGEASNGSAVFKSNYLMGAPVGLLLGLWNNATVEDNTIWAYDTLVDITAASRDAVGKNYKINRNTYIENGSATPFKALSGNLSFKQWQALGFDPQGSMVQGKDGGPTGSKVFLFPNKYEKGRANLGIFNWANKVAVGVDLSSVLGRGQKYRIYNCLDIKQTISSAKAVLEGTYTGAEVTIPMRRDKVSPNFETFLVLPVEVQ